MKAPLPKAKRLSLKAPSKPRTAKLESRAQSIIDRLKKEYPDAHCELDHDNALQLLVATILSAQCTDERVNQVTPALFARFPTAKDLAQAEPEDIEKIIFATGFYRNKTKSIIKCARTLVESFGGQVPRTMAELVTLGGVGRKTANVILGNCFGKPEGLVVDTHVKRLSSRMGLTTEDDPEKIEADLSPRINPADWTVASHLLIWHGRYCCNARDPQCARCVVNDLCPSDTTGAYKGAALETLIGRVAARRVGAEEAARNRKDLRAPSRSRR